MNVVETNSFAKCTCITKGLDSAVGIVAHCGLDGPGIESQWGRDFLHPASYTTGTGSFPWVKRLGCGVDHPLPSSTDVKERVELYLGLRGLL